MKIYKTLVFAFLLAIPSLAQDQVLIRDRNSSCEEGSFAADHVIIEAKKLKEKISVLFYRGKNEKKKYNQKRLKNIKSSLICLNGWNKLVEYGLEFKIADEILENPKVEFLIGDELYVVYNLKPKQYSFCTFCCYEPDESKQVLKNCQID